MISKLKKLFLGVSLLFSTSMSLSSCSSFMQAEYNSIQSISTRQDENGNTIVTITYTDDSYAPVSFTIPKGETGENGQDGVGIDDIQYITNADGSTTIIISFTSDEVDDVEFNLPSPTNITNIESVHDDDNSQTVITITLSNNETYTFNIPDPQDGKDGVGIANVAYDDSGQDGYYIITITYTDPNMEPTVIRLPSPGKDGIDGEDGRGIVSIISNYDEDNYYIIVTYTDNTQDTLTFPAPEQGTRWFSGSGEPNPLFNMELLSARAGDFYFDLEGMSIYRYNGTSWSFVCNVGTGSARDTCRVTFNATANGGTLINAVSSYIDVEYGKCISASDLPLASKADATFIGWYTSSQGPSNPNAGHLTSLTPIFNDLEVYACFEPLSN